VRHNGATNSSYPAATAEVTFARKSVPTQMIQRSDLPSGSVVEGPAIVSEPTATAVVPPGATLRVDPFGSLVVAAGKEL
jgi:N-methylhydantoinase A